LALNELIHYDFSKKNKSGWLKTRFCFYIFVSISGILTQPTLKIPMKRTSIIGFFHSASSLCGDSESTGLSPKLTHPFTDFLEQPVPEFFAVRTEFCTVGVSLMH